MKPNIAAIEMIADQTGDVFVRVGPGGVVRYVSSSIRIYGYEPEEVIGCTAVGFVHPDDRAKVIANTQATFRGENLSPVDRVHRFRTGDGSWIWVEGNPRVLRDRRGRITGAVNVLRNITERREAELKAAESVAIRRSAFEHEGVGKALVDVDGAFLAVNNALCDLLGYTESELLKVDFQSITHPEDLDADLELLGRLSRGEIANYRLDKRYLRSDGSVVWVELTVSMIEDADGRPKLFIAQVQDQTKRRAAEAALVQSEARYRLLAENSADMMACFGPDHVFSYLSPAVEALLGYRPEELVGEPIRRIMHPDDYGRVIDLFRSHLAGPSAREPFSFEYRAVRKDGSEVWLAAHPRAVFDAVDGRLTGFQDVVRDVSAQKAGEHMLAAAKAEAEAAADAKALFLATMSHELRTPLTAVVGFARLTAEQSDLPPVARSYVDRLLVGAKALMATINDILDFSKLEAGQVEIRETATSPDELLRESVGMFEGLASDRGLRLVMQWSSDAPEALLLDGDRLRQVLLNLVGNAVKFTETGEVVVEVGYDPASSRLRCTVSDSGPGMTKDQQALLFQRFSQVDGSLARKHGGTGLGLAICKGIVDAMGGEIGVVAAPGAGARFWFELPAEPAVPPAGSSFELGDPIAQCRILLAEDNSTNRELVRLILRPFGVDLIEAADGAEAVRLATDWPVDLILMDLRMPKLDGREAASAIRAGDGPNAGVPILAFSADAVPELGPFDGAVRKPLDAGALIRAIVDALAPQGEAYGVARAAG